MPLAGALCVQCKKSKNPPIRSARGVEHLVRRLMRHQ